MIDTVTHKRLTESWSLGSFSCKFEEGNLWTTEAELCEDYYRFLYDILRARVVGKEVAVVLYGRRGCLGVRYHFTACWGTC